MNIIRASLTLICLGFFLLEPDLILNAAKNAIDTWAVSVLPALLPFFILNNLCFTYGGITLFGALLQTLTRGIFNLPGEVAFVMATGYSTGAPVSAGAIAALYKDKKITTTSGNLLLPFTSNVSPLFIFSVVAAGFLGRGDLGLSLALVHYGSNLILGSVILVLCRPKEKPEGSSLKNQLTALREKPAIPLGQGLSQGIEQGVKTIVLIGGLLIVFFIFLEVIHFLALDTIIAYILSFTGLDPQVTLCLIQGITEITAGAKCTAVTNLPINIKFSTISFILAFGGISALCQIATQIKDTDLSLKFYFFYKMLQGFLAWFISLYVPISQEASTLIPAWTNLPHPTAFMTVGILLPLSLLAGVFILRHLPHKRWRKAKSFYR